MTATANLPDPRPDHGKHRARTGLTWGLFLLTAAGVAVGALNVVPSGPHPSPAARATAVLQTADRVDDLGARPGRFAATAPATAPTAAPTAPAAVSTPAPAAAARPRRAAAPHVTRAPAPAAATTAAAAPSPVADPQPQLPREVIGRQIDCVDGSVGVVVDANGTTSCPQVTR